MNPAASAARPRDPITRREGGRAVLLCLVVTLAFTALSARLVQLQAWRHEEFKQRVEAAQRTRVELPARRGELRDRNGLLLASDQAVHDLYLDKIHLRHSEVAARTLARRDGMSVRDVRRLFSGDELVRQHLTHVARIIAQGLRQPEDKWIEQLLAESPVEITVAKGLEDRAKKLWRAWLQKNGIKSGVYFRDAVRRFYTHADRLTQTIGYVDHTHRGREGLEATVDEWLQGEPGFRDIERDGHGRELPSYQHAHRPPRHGHHVHLTLDMHLQEILEQTLEQASRDLKAAKIMAVLIEPDSGNVLALGARPAWIRGAALGTRRNLPVADVYEPGSTFKMITLAAAFEEAVCQPDTVFFCHNGYYSDDSLPVPLRDAGSYGNLTAIEIFAKSSNIGTYQMARRLGSIKLHRHAEAFGFGSPTDIQLTAEVGGTLRPPSQWSGTSLSRVMMGYEVSVTPLQMALATAAIANGGRLMRPRIIDRIVDRDGSTVKTFAPEEVRRVVSAETAAKVRDAMVAVTSDEGTGSRARVEGIEVAGKTGTARKFDPATGGYAPGRYVASFTGFAPARDPLLAAVIVVDDPGNDPDERGGGRAAAPVFAEITRRAIAHLHSAGAANRRPIQEPANE